MLMITYVEYIHSLDKPEHPADACPLDWVLDGRAFAVRSKDALVAKWLPLFFRQAKFSSFTRKLYRWGFRQIDVSEEKRRATDIFFGNENFQRDRKDLMSDMRSMTAATMRRERANQELEERQEEQQQKQVKEKIESNTGLSKIEMTAA